MAFNIVVIQSTGGTAEVITQPPYEAGMIIEMLATPDSGFYLENWRLKFVSDITVDGGENFKFTMPSTDVELEPNFSVEVTEPPGEEIPDEVEEPEDPDYSTVVIDYEATDLYDSCIVFTLVRDMKEIITPFTVLGDNYFQAYEHAEILEPIGWDGVYLETQRDRDTHGFTAIIGVEELTFRCNTGQEFLEASEFIGGSDTDVKLIVSENGRFVASVQLNFEQYRKDINGVYLSVEEAPFDGLFATRKDTKYPFELDKNLFMYSPSKYIYTSWGYFKPALQWSGARPPQDITSLMDSRLHFNVFAERTNEEVEKAYQYPASITTYRDGNDLKAPDTLVFARGGKINVSISLGIVTYFRNLVPSGGNPGTDQISLVLKVTLLSRRGDETAGSSREGSVVPVIDEQSYPTSTYMVDFYDTLGKGPVETQEPGEVEARVNVFEKSWDVTVYAGDVLKVEVFSEYVFQDVFDALPNQNVAAYVLQEFVDKATGEHHKLGTLETDGLVEVTGDFVGKASITEAVTLRDLMATVSAQMLEVSETPIVSGIGEDKIIYLTPGHALRRAEEEKEYTSSFNELWGGANPILGLGYNVEIRGEVEKIKIDYAHSFYRKDRAVGIIHDLQTLNVYEENADTERTYNELEVGYSKFSKERETNKRMTAYDAHGRQEYLTPVRKTKNKLPLISSFVASQYSMDDMRVKQFDVDAVESTMPGDDELYMITATGSVVDRSTVSHVKWIRGLGRVVSDRGERELGNINGLQVRTDVILPFSIGDEVTFTTLTWMGISFTKIIKDIFYQPVAVDSDQYDTIVMFDELTEEESNSVTDFVDVRMEYSPRIIPESTEPFSLIEGTQSGETSYNLRFTPKRMLLNNHRLVNVGLLKKSDGDLITLQNIEGNSRVATQYTEEAKFIGGDINRSLVQENGNRTLESFGDRESLHQPYTIHLNYSDVSYAFYVSVLLGHKTNRESSYGLIEVLTPFGELVRGFLDICRFYPGKRTMELTLLLYDRRPYFAGEYLADVDGTFILTTQGEFIIVEK